RKLTSFSFNRPCVRSLLVVFGLVCASGSLLAQTTWRSDTERGVFTVTLDAGVAHIPIATLQSWQLTLQQPDGRPVSNARVVVGGGMRAHGHGLPTQPEVMSTGQPGLYTIEGLRFNMSGEWTLALSIDSANGRDRVLFELTLTDLPTADGLAALALDKDWRPPPSPSNRVADSLPAASLGRELFFDESLSGAGTSSCASCHQPARFLADGERLGQGRDRAMRNTPSLIGASAQSWFYWDGRRDSLWSQALVPFEAVEEMGGSRLAVVRTVLIAPHYREQYARVFGKPPDIDFARLPAEAGPIGSAMSKAAWAELSRQDQIAINTVFANVGKAIAAFERSLPAPPSPFDLYVADRRDVGEQDSEARVGSSAHQHAMEHAIDRNRQRPLDASALRGLALFMDSNKTNCLRCHNGPWFSNQGFHNIGTGNFSGERLDFGRVYGLQAAIRDEFNCLGPYSDTRPEACTEQRFLSKHSHVPLEGAFKVPTLRNLKHTAPYMHDGRYATLREVVEHYRNPPSDGPPHELQALVLSDAEVDDLVRFLESLSGAGELRMLQQESGNHEPRH
ncbi:MAG: cytochrome c peroxidase, partial [Pseudomonadota bacterium]